MDNLDLEQRYYELCRLCASHDAVMVDIFNEEGKDRQLIDKIQACLPFKVTEDDCLPKYLCHRCMYNLENFYDFRTACVNAVVLLERYLPINKIVGDVEQRIDRDREILQQITIIPEAPVVDPNDALGTPPRFNFSDEEEEEEEEREQEASVEEDSSPEDENEETAKECEPNPGDFLEMTSILMDEAEGSKPKEEVYICSLCNKAFSSKGHLSLHSRIHQVDDTNLVIGEKIVMNDDFKRPYRCDLCNKSYSTAKHRWGHVSTTHRGHPAVTCAYCSRIYSTRTNLEEHIKSRHSNLLERAKNQYYSKIRSMKIVEDNNIYICELCTRDFNDRPSLWLHIRATHKEFAAFACGICLKICPDNKELLNHVNVEHGGSKLSSSEQRRYSCTICGRQHDSRKKLITHVSIHNINPAYDPASFVVSNNNEDTSRLLDFDATTVSTTTTEEKQSQHHLFFVCELCGKSFTSKWERWLHVNNTHENEITMKCDREDCEKVFATRSLRDEHVQRHHLVQGIVPNTCEICGKLWGSRVDYWKHVMGVHPDTVPLICGVCLKVCTEIERLKEHVRSKHWPLSNGNGGEFFCDVCGRGYSNKSKMSRHRKIHGLDDKKKLNEDSLKCDLCPELKFFNSIDLLKHRKWIHNLFPCDLCHKFYGRSSHLWKHVNRCHKGHRDVTCAYCFKTSASKDHLETHVAKIHKIKMMDYEGVEEERVQDTITSIEEEEEEEEKEENDEDDGEEEDEGEINDKCEKCGKGFRKGYLLHRHKKSCQTHRKDAGALLTRCRACERIFKDRSSLQKHIENHHSTYECHLCNSTITSKLGIMTHNRTNHLNHPDLTCDYPSCKKLFRTREDLQLHRVNHNDTPDLNVCDYCGDSVENKLKLKMHVLSLHRNEIGISCGVCLIPRKDPTELKSHVEESHPLVLEQSNTCKVCGKQYASKWKAYDHTNKCHGKVFKTCKQCLNVFLNDDELMRHLEIAHRSNNNKSGEEVTGSRKRLSSLDTFDCDLCPEIFINDLSLLEHYKNVHSDRINDHSVPSMVVKKKKKDSFECNDCLKKFTSRSMFWNHLKICKKSPTNHSVPDFHLFEDINYLHNIGTCKKNSRKVYDESTNVPCTCEVCGKEWPAKKHLWQHLIRFHRKHAAVTCGVCLKLSHSYKELKEHLNELHAEVLNTEGNNFTCKVCGRYHNARSKLLLHIGIHVELNDDDDEVKEEEEQLIKEEDEEDEEEEEEDNEYSETSMFQSNLFKNLSDIDLVKKII